MLGGGINSNIQLWALSGGGMRGKWSLVCSVFTTHQVGMDSDCTVPAAYMICEFLRKWIQNCKHKIKYKNEHLFRMRKESTINYKYLKATSIIKVKI